MKLDYLHNMGQPHLIHRMSKQNKEASLPKQ